MLTSSPCIDETLMDGPAETHLCNICAEERPFLVACPSPECGEQACQECIERFVLENATEPKCMYCRVVYSDDFLYGVMPPKFQDIYRSARVDELLSREKSLLPQTQEYVEDLRNQREVNRIRDQFEAQRKKVVRPRKAASPFYAWKHLYEHPPELRRYPGNSDTFKHQMKADPTLRTAINNLVAEDAARFTRETEVYQRELAHLREIEGTLRDIAGAEYAAETMPRREVVFNRPCPYPECRGYVSSAWKCGLCERYSCSRCHEPKNGRDDPDHVCNEDTVATIALLANDTKPCPNPSCGTPITKLSGCDQMWCPTCHWAFSWRTGERVRAGGVIHNPHYFEHQRAMNNGVIPRQPGDIPGGDPCGGVPDTRTIQQSVRNRWRDQATHAVTEAVERANNAPHDPELRREILRVQRAYDPGSYDTTLLVSIQTQFFGEIARYVHHLDGVLMPSFPTADTPEMFQHLRGRYLLSEITEGDWRRELVRQTKVLDRNRELALVLQFFRDSLVDTLQHLCNTEVPLPTETARDQVINLRDYTVRQLARLRIKFGTVVPHIGWRSEIRYALLRDLRRTSQTRTMPESPADLPEGVRVYAQFLEERNFNMQTAKGAAPLPPASR